MYRIIALCALVAGFISPASAGVIFHATPGAFNAAVAGLNFLGTEDFESSTLAAASIQIFDDALQPGIASAPVNVFPTGTNVSIGMTAQANALGGMPNAPSQRGVDALATASAGFASTPDDQLSTNFEGDSLDLIFVSPVTEPILAVSLTPLFFDSAFDITALGDIVVRVFDTSNVLLGSTTVTGVDYVQELAFIGIQTDGGDDIGRINLWDGDSVNHWQGVDDINVYAARPTPPTPMPEPGTLVLMAAGIAAFGARRKR